MAEEAAKFHRMAASIHRELGDRWHLAVALVNLGASVREAEGPVRARVYETEAVDILARFNDPRAVRLRDRLLGNA